MICLIHNVAYRHDNRAFHLLRLYRSPTYVQSYYNYQNKYTKKVYYLKCTFLLIAEIVPQSCPIFRYMQVQVCGIHTL